MIEPVARLEAIRDDALSLADRLQRDMEAVAEARESANVDDEHDPEGSTIAYERSQLDAIRRSALERAGDASAALDRIGDGTFGRCERCGARIGGARLEARPTARLCIDCAR
ncbi:TraR/DksA family transcriptional regulator [Frigoribacterium faeni]|uniref:DnaK suppressor protein n=1 Tax=Frigoribacterium faeni TaxID=145483 RepID=A0A7W3JGV5_9MICO|nr:TraR/DksA family transcriptional regulator [Frigoribacterium faeni]MBA8812616.1 RNA polymerase-binding transcription factor DksA [Frigoribacterium faeni]BFF13719.1 TraR/DksA C4-type zinc finger protein [Microbacterium flavescens]GEK82371.1 DnaK suppressor protein [Frigoribacterium faeni]